MEYLAVGIQHIIIGSLLLPWVIVGVEIVPAIAIR